MLWSDRHRCAAPLPFPFLLSFPRSCFPRITPHRFRVYCNYFLVLYLSPAMQADQLVVSTVLQADSTRTRRGMRGGVEYIAMRHSTLLERSMRGKQAGRGTSGFSSKQTHPCNCYTLFTSFQKYRYPDISAPNLPSLGCMIPGNSLNWRVGVVLI